MLVILSVGCLFWFWYSTKCLKINLCSKRWYQLSKLPKMCWCLYQNDISLIWAVDKVNMDLVSPGDARYNLKTLKCDEAIVLSTQLRSGGFSKLMIMFYLLQVLTWKKRRRFWEYLITSVSSQEFLVEIFQCFQVWIW